MGVPGMEYGTGCVVVEYKNAANDSLPENKWTNVPQRQGLRMGWFITMLP